MNPIAMAAIWFSLVGMFAWSAHHRWNLMMVGGPTKESRFDRMGERLVGVWTFAFWQKRMRYYFWAGLAHNLIFAGFVVLALRTLILWGRGVDPEFNLFILGPEPVAGLPLGDIYAFLKDSFAVLVILGALVFVYYRVINVQTRMKLSVEGLIILLIILTMMITDILYDGASTVLWHRAAEICGGGDAASCEAVTTIVAHKMGPAASTAIGWHAFPEPAGSAAAVALQGVGTDGLVVVAHAGFWTHATLVLVFLNLLPYSKHFHVITAIPNVMHRDLDQPGRLRPLAKNTEEMMALVEKATEDDDLGKYPIGYARIEHFTWKDILDFYTCTECGRCSDNCPAFTTGKILSPKALTVDLRDHLYERQEEFATLPGAPHGGVPLPEISEDGDEEESKDDDSKDSDSDSGANGAAKYEPIDLVPNVVHEDVLWACTTCRACEEQCPVMITYVDKIVSMRRNLVTIRGEFPAELNKPFEAMETNGNPWNLSQMDRANWAEGLDLKTFAEHPETKVLFWVGCAASYDDRAKKISRATALLLKQAGIDFAILGEEETCTGDPARRAGNEFLALTLQEANTETLNGYKEQGGVEKIITTCPHCFNTLLNEYPDVGGKFDVVHHTEYLLDLVQSGKLKPTEEGAGEVVYHDSCYLGRYNEVYDAPRELLRALPSTTVLEADYWNRNKGLCCGAGGAQMWMEEQNKDRVSVKRTKQLLESGAKTIASACPFCMTMLTDGLKAEGKEDSIQQKDVVELLAIACGVDEKAPKAEAEEGEAAEEAAAPA